MSKDCPISLRGHEGKLNNGDPREFTEDTDRITSANDLSSPLRHHIRMVLLGQLAPRTSNLSTTLSICYTSPLTTPVTSLIFHPGTF